jgi:DNA-directed RNA polymerase subunit L
VIDPEIAAAAVNVLDKERSYFRNKRGDPTRIQFSMESEVALTPKQIMVKAFDILITKLERVKASVNNEEVDTGFLTTREASPGYEFVFKNEDDTLGNLLQSLIYNDTIRKAKPLQSSEPTLTYVGYCCPHPLDPVMVLRLVIDPDTEQTPTADTYKTFFRSHVDRIHAMLTGLRAAWMDFAPK